MSEGVEGQYVPGTIREMPAEERPRERLINHGANALSGAELMAILLRTGMKGENVVNMSHRLMGEFGGLTGIGGAVVSDLCAVKGISEAKACQVLAAVELGKRMFALAPPPRLKITTAMSVFNLLASDVRFLVQEHLYVLLLDSSSTLIGRPLEVYKGTVNAAMVRVSEVLRPAIRANAPGIIIVHNHPSGDPTPSGPDIEITRRIYQAAKEMDIELHDHIVIGHDQFVSMKQRSLGFP